MALQKVKKRIFEIIQVGRGDDWVSRGFDIALITLILANLFIAVFSTFESSEPYRNVLAAVELMTVAAFTVEYILRLWTAEYLYPAAGRLRAAGQYMLSFNGIIDLLSFFPYYLPIFFPAGAVAFRIFRVVRIFRLFRVNAYYDALNVIGEVLRAKRDQLLSSIFIILVLMTASSLFMYGLEHEAQPDVFKNAFSGFWWAVSTLLTVGYGDIYPITVPGRIFGTVLTFLGVGMVAIPTGILSAGFVEQYTRLKSLSDFAQESDIHFIRVTIEPGHPWVDRPVADLGLPPDIVPAVIQRGGDVLAPKGDTVIREGDRVALGAEGFTDDAGLTLREVALKDRHPWTGVRIRDLDIPRRTSIIMVRRDGKLLIPTGDLCLQPEDEVLLYTRRRASSAPNEKT